MKERELSRASLCNANGHHSPYSWYLMSFHQSSHSLLHLGDLIRRLWVFVLKSISVLLCFSGFFTLKPLDLSWTSFWSPYKDTAPHWNRSTGEMCECVCVCVCVMEKAGLDPSYYNPVRRFRFSVYVYICACVFMRRFNIAHWMSIFHVVLDLFF